MTTRLKKQRQKLTAKFCDHISAQGEYLDYGGPVAGLILNVGTTSNSKSWLLRYRYRGKRREMGLGSYPETTLAAAREKGAEEQLRLGRGSDPIAHRKEQRRLKRAAEAKNLTFLQIGEKFIAMKMGGDNPWWRSPHSQKKQSNLLKYQLKPVHDYQLNSIETADALTLRLHEMLDPIWLKTPCWARDIKFLASMICDHAYALKILPMNVANPAGKPLDVLLGVRQPLGGQWRAAPYQKMPAIYAKLDALCKPAYDWFTIREAARAVGKPRHIIEAAIHNGLRAVKTFSPFNNHMMGDQEWRIEPADLFERWPKVHDVIPGLPSVVKPLIKFIVLNGSRPSEVLNMKWSEYDPNEGLWILPWDRTKEGREIRQDLVIPLNHRSIDILNTMKAQQHRDGIKTDYVFANYYSRFTYSAVTIGVPPSGGTTLLRSFRKTLPPEEIKACLHGIRTAFRSWGDDESNPDGTPRFVEKDLERAINHAAGFGETEMSRKYSRQAKRIRALIPIFDGWADFLANSDAANIIPFRRQQAIGG